MPRRFAVAVFGQFEAVYSKWSARAQGDMSVNWCRDPLPQRGRQSSLTQDMVRSRGHRPSGREHERARFNVKTENCLLAGIPRCLRSAQQRPLVRDMP